MNKEAFAKIDLEMKKFKGDVMNLFENMENKQKLQLDNIKYVLEHSGSKRLNRLSKRILGKKIELKKVSEPENKYKKPTEDEISEAKKQIKRKTTMKKDDKYFLTINEESENQSVSIFNDMQDINEMDRRVSNNFLNEEDISKKRKVSELKNELEPTPNFQNKGSYYLKPEDFQLKPKQISNRNSLQTGNINNNNNPKTIENNVPKSSVFSKKNDKFFYDIN